MKLLAVLAAMLLLVTATHAGSGLIFPDNSSVADNNASSPRFKWTNPHLNGLPIYGPGGQGVTYIWVYYPQQQTGYYTTFFWGNDDGVGDLSTFLWDGGAADSYYGAHPYPRGGSSGTVHDWEVSVEQNDYVNGLVVKNVSYRQALVVWEDGSGNKHHEFYWDLPNVDSGHKVTRTSPPTWGETNPPSPALTWGDAPWQPGKELGKGIHRGIRIYNNRLSEADIVSESELPLSTVAGASNIWYLNMDPTPTDISDKSGNGNNPSWVSAARPTLYSDTACSLSGIGNTVLEQAANGLAAGEWCEMTPAMLNFTLNATDVGDIMGGCGDGSTSTWLHNYAYDPSQGSNGIVAWGGTGHGSSYRSLYYDVGTNTWELGPTTTGLCGSESTCTYSDWEGTSIQRCASCNAEHTYDSMTSDNAGNFYREDYGSFGPNIIQRITLPSTWNKTWDSSGPGGTDTSAMEFWPDFNGGVLLKTASGTDDLYWRTIASSSWTYIGVTAPSGNWNNTINYNHGSGDVRVTTGGSGNDLNTHYRLWDNSGTPTLTALANAPSGRLGLDRSNCTDDPVNSSGKFVCWNNSADTVGMSTNGWYEYDMGTDTWTSFGSGALSSIISMPPLATAGAPQLHGVASVTIPELGVLIWVSEEDDDTNNGGMFVYKHSAFTTSPTIDLTCASPNDFKTYAEGLECGETLRVRDSATCTNTSKIILAHQCSAGSPVTITNYPGESPLIDQSSLQNTINIENSQYLTINGLEITSTGGGDGIVLSHSSNAYITISDNVIHNVTVGIGSQAHNADNLTITGNEIYDTSATGEGLYLGLHGDCSTGTSNSTITGNYIHDLGGTDRDGIEMKCGSYGNLVADNVISDASNNGAGAGIQSFGTEGGSGVASPNIIERNLIMNCIGSAGEGILTMGETIVRNNIVLNCDGGGIESYNVSPAGGTIQNVTIVNNTVYNSGSGVDCLWLNNSLDSTVIIANNALYCPNGFAVWDSGSGGAPIVRNNYVNGGVGGAGASNWSIDNNEFYAGGTAADAFINPNVPPTASDFYPKSGSLLIDAGNATYAPADDFNDATRTGTDDVGAYESGVCSYNNGWAIADEFKEDAAACVAGTCGDGTIDAPTEECDDDVDNGTIDSCCSATCQFNADTVACTSDSNGCTDDFCAGTSNTCVYTNNTDACDDSLYCNGADTCSGGSCSSHAGDPCPGPDADTDCSETCNEGADDCSANDPNASVCGDQTATTCNAANTCLSGTCEDNYATDGTTCTDSLYCNGTDQCLTGACATHAGDPCPGADGDSDCSEVCVEATDSCTGNDPDGSACNADGRECTEPDTCTTGTCNPGPLVCPQFRGTTVKGGKVR